MKIVYTFLVLFIIISCERNEKKTCEDDSKHAQNCKEKEEKIDSLLDRDFIEKMNKQISINDSKLVDAGVVYDGDTVYFPNVLNQNQTYQLLTNSKKEKITLKRISKSTIRYTYEQNKESIKGIAILDPNYFVNQNLDTDSKTKENYGSDEYIDEHASKKDINVHIRIGRSVNKDGKRRSLIYIESKSKRSILKSSKTLYEQ